MSCPICNEQRFWPLPFNDNPVVARWRAEAGRTDYGWRLCQRCANAYPTQQPDLAVLQQVWATNRTDECLSPEAREQAWSYRRRVSRIGAARSFRLFAPLAARPKGRFLDIGCGLGDTVKVFADHGWDAEGIDADPTTAPFHREFAIKARIGQIEQLAVDGNYDIIHIAHAIYFVTDPMNFIRAVRERLAPDGVFCVVLADFMANADGSLSSSGHTFYPTGASMRYALAIAGFETVMSKHLSGSIYLAARRADAPKLPAVHPAATLLLHRTKPLRYAVIGRPYLALRRLAARLLGRP